MQSRAIVEVIDNLTSESATAALSANQGRVLKELIEDAIEEAKSSIKAGDTLNYKDLNTLKDKTYIGYGHNLTNAPYGSAGYIINIPNPNNPTNYAKQFYMHFQSNIVYTRYYLNGAWSNWVEINSDTGWVTLSLLGNVQAYTTGSTPQYRKIGNVVYLRGSVKNVLVNNTNICQLPEGFRPVGTSHNYIQNTTYANGSANMSRINIGTDGIITIEGITTGLGASYGESKWFPLDTSFIVD